MMIGAQFPPHQAFDVFLVAGEEKSDAVARAFGGGPTPEAPGSLVRPHSGELTLLLDTGAASRLSKLPE